MNADCKPLRNIPDTDIVFFATWQISGFPQELHVQHLININDIIQYLMIKSEVFC
jgi:hypothetical protein